MNCEEGDDIKNQQKIPVVTHLTQVVFHLDDRRIVETAALPRQNIGPAAARRFGVLMLERVNRIAAMMELLAVHGFYFERKGPVIHGYSHEIEAYEAKRILLEAGFRDCEFQIILEYTRGWGML